MANAVKYPDGDYDLSKLRGCLNSDFNSEKELCDYIEENIQLFCRDCLSVSYQSHRREYPLEEGRRTKGTRRIDFLIITSENERIGIECKHPITGSELGPAIGQVLSYMTLFERYGRPLARIIIVTTKLDPVSPFVIDKFNLPIGLIGFDKDKFLTYKNGSSDRK